MLTLVELPGVLFAGAIFLVLEEGHDEVDELLDCGLLREGVVVLQN